MTWDKYQKNFIFDHGGTIDESGIAHFQKSNTLIMDRLGRSIRYPFLRTLVIPSVHGTCLIFELMHFIIE